MSEWVERPTGHRAVAEKNAKNSRGNIYLPHPVVIQKIPEATFICHSL